jgi:predicted RNA-binding protein with PIN domain
MDESFIIDGFNFTHYMAKCHNAKAGHLEARPNGIKEILYYLESHIAVKGRSATVVFDGTRYKDEIQPSQWLKLLFSQPGETADQVIERLMSVIDPAKRIQHILVSNDHALRQMAVGLGVRVQRPAEFLDSLQVDSTSILRKDEPPQKFNKPFEEKL